ncbi:MAG TPA: sigma-70 family RNA polymerase sigma factor [Polyangiaceae bacterium]|jgi:RNA polymerase sigma-70 factor (ECF subfamily)
MSTAGTKRVGLSDGERARPVARLPFFESDAAIVAALRARQPAGGAALYDRHHEHVRRVLIRLLGPGAHLGDLVQDVFVSAIDSIDRLERPDSLRAWLASIAVFRARAEIRARARSRWFPLFADDELPEADARVATPEIDEAVRTTYLVLEKLAADERIAFALRFVDGMELVEVAEACEVSLATIKRRLARAQSKFMNIARTYPALSEWLERGDRWT